MGRDCKGKEESGSCDVTATALSHLTDFQDTKSKCLSQLLLYCFSVQDDRLCLYNLTSVDIMVRCSTVYLAFHSL